MTNALLDEVAKQLIAELSIGDEIWEPLDSPDGSPQFFCPHTPGSDLGRKIMEHLDSRTEAELRQLAAGELRSEDIRTNVHDNTPSNLKQVACMMLIAKIMQLVPPQFDRQLV